MGSTYATSVRPGVIRYAAPELFTARVEKHGRLLSAVDIYSFGCVAFEVLIPPHFASSILTQNIQVLSGRTPHYDLTEPLIIIALSRKERTPRPEGSQLMTDEWWQLINQCWSDIPDDRPSVKDILSYLRTSL